MKQEKEQETKKRSNKKYFAFGFIALFAIAFVTAGLVTNFFSQENEFQVTNPISVSGDQIFSQAVIGGDMVVGELFEVSNDGSVDVPVEVINNAEIGIDVEYKGTLTVAQKNVDFTQDVWTLLGGGLEATVEYTIVGDEFTAEVTEGDLTDYTLVYYKDNSDRFNNPATGILVGDVNANLPYETDGNADEYDYCVTGEYDTCHGAKIWYIPNIAIDIDGNIDFTQAANFLFETELVQFNDLGAITMYSNTNTEFTPEYTFDVLLESGTYTVTTEVNPIIA